MEKAAALREFVLVAISESLIPCIRDIAERKCHGCQIDHPSQRQHDVCLMMTVEERVELCFDEALDLLLNQKKDDARTTYYDYVEAHTPQYQGSELATQVIEDELMTKDTYPCPWREDMKRRLVYVMPY